MENKLIYSNNLFKKLKISILLNKIIPNLDNSKIKGDNGVIGVIGGSFEYTGAPYYSAISALKTGSDLSHIFCPLDAALPIKSYSPELIVHPAFDNNKEDKNLLSKSVRWFKSMDSLIIGPGLGREDATFNIFKEFLNQSLNVNKLIHILDADALWHFMNLNLENISLEKSFIIFTPNKVEFGRLYQKFVNLDNSSDLNLFNMSVERDEIILIEDLNKEEIRNLFKNEIELANSLKNRIILKKGAVDIITDGNIIYIVGNQGSLKRCGGIGDILNGIIATFCSMLKKECIKKNYEFSNENLLEAVALACYVCRNASNLAYMKHGYSLTAPDVIVEVAKTAINYKF